MLIRRAAVLALRLSIVLRVTRLSGGGHFYFNGLGMIDFPVMFDRHGIDSEAPGFSRHQDIIITRLIVERAGHDRDIRTRTR